MEPVRENKEYIVSITLSGKRTGHIGDHGLGGARFSPKKVVVLSQGVRFGQKFMPKPWDNRARFYWV